MKENYNLRISKTHFQTFPLNFQTAFKTAEQKWTLSDRKVFL